MIVGPLFYFLFLCFKFLQVWQEQRCVFFTNKTTCDPKRAFSQLGSNTNAKAGPDKAQFRVLMSKNCHFMVKKRELRITWLLIGLFVVFFLGVYSTLIASVVVGDIEILEFITFSFSIQISKLTEKIARKKKLEWKDFWAKVTDQQKNIKSWGFLSNSHFNKLLANYVSLKWGKKLTVLKNWQC